MTSEKGRRPMPCAEDLKVQVGPVESNVLKTETGTGTGQGSNLNLNRNRNRFQ
jgi:hypothetical protein